MEEKLKKAFRPAALAAAVCLLLAGCKFLSSIDDDDDEPEFGTLSLDASEVSLDIGSMEIVKASLSKNQNKATVEWEYDGAIVSGVADSYGIVLTGLAAGQTTLTASCAGQKKSCVVTVSDVRHKAEVENPYIYASSDVVNVVVGSQEKIFASAFGSDNDVISSWSFSCDNSAVAGLYTEGNYCWITGLKTGQARITVSNSKVSAYPYTVLVNSYIDSVTTPYITTESNVVSINLSETDTADISVELKNPADTSTKNDFTYRLVDKDGNDASDGVFTVDGANGNFRVTASGAGMAVLRVSHSDSQYDLDIILRASNEADLTSVGTGSSIVTIEGDYPQTVSFYLQNLPDGKSDDGSGWSFKYSDGADSYASFTESGGGVAVTPKAPGMVKITASHAYSSVSCSVCVIIKNLSSSAASASTYITTSQNYITLAPDGESTFVTVTIYNAKAGSEKSLKWSIKSEADDGSAGNLVEFAGGDGTAEYVSSALSSRAAYSITDCVICTGEIKPLGKTGTARITLSHPDALYPAEIIVKVKNAEKAAAETLSLAVDSKIVSLLPGKSAQLTATLSGSSLSSGDENTVTWECTSTDVSFAGSGATAFVFLPESFTGSGTGTITASSEKAGNTVRIPLMYAGSEEELDALKAVFATGPNTFTLYTGDKPAHVVLGTMNLAEEDMKAITWTVESGNNSVISVDVVSKDCIDVTPLSKGVGQVKASAEGIGEVVYYFVVKTGGVIDDTADCYLTTSDNVVYFPGQGVTKEFSVSGVNLTTYQLRNCAYTAEPEGLYSIVFDNGKFTAESLSETGEARVTVSHPLSENRIEIVLRTGNEYDYVNPDIPYISSSVQSLQMLVGGDEKMLTFAVAHTQADTVEEKGFTFSLKDGSETSATTIANSVVSASFAPDGSLILVKPEAEGVTELYVDYEGCQQISVPIVVSSETAIEDIPYITTDSNVVTVIEGEYTPVTAFLKNCASSSDDDWTWIPEDFDVASVAVSKGSTVMLLGKKAGNTTLRVSNSNVSPEYALSLTVVCVDKSVAETKPYIQLSKNVVTLTTGESQTLTAEMVGGSADASLYFEWTCSDTSVAFVSNTANDAVLVKGLKAGLTTVTVTNGKYPVDQGYYSKRVVVRVEDDSSEGRYVKLSTTLLQLDPDSTDGTRITATLVNSDDDTDAQNFIWWVDDPTLVTFSSNAGTAVVVPTGLSGTTYVHCKHPKTVKTADVVVYVSKYTDFGFPDETETIQEGKVYFLSMQVPETESESYVEYESQDADVCVIEGTKSVCFIEGTGQGQVILTAYLRNKATGKAIAQANLPVYVRSKAASDIEVTPSVSILNVKISEQATISATVSGTGIVAESANLELKWRWKTAGVTEDKMYVLKPTSQAEASGPSVLVTAKQAGEYILECYYVSGGETYSADILITVPAAKEKRITIPTSKTVFKSDDSFELSATIVNSDSTDLQNLKWSAGKYKGKNILRVTTSGETTTCMPSAVGNSVVYARLDDGTVSNPCIVIIKPDATFSFASQAVHVIPGQTEEVPFELDPAGTNMLYESIGTNGLTASDYYTYEVDNVDCKLKVRGLKAYDGAAAGTIKAVIIGKSGSGLDSLGNNSSLTVYCENDPTLETSLASQVYIQNPDTAVKGYLPKSSNGARVPKPSAQIRREQAQRKFTYTAWPSDMNVSITVTKNGAAATDLLTWEVSEETVFEGGRNVKNGSVKLIPHGECNGDDNVRLVIKGTPPSDGSNSYASKTLYYPVVMTYDAYEIKLRTKDLQAGAFTGYDEKKGITLGDGEELVFAIDIDRDYNENASTPVIISKAYTANSGSYEASREDYTPASEKGFVELKESGAADSDTGAVYMSLRHKFDHMQFTPPVEKDEAKGGWTDATRLRIFREDENNTDLPDDERVMPEYFYISREMLGKFSGSYTLTDFEDKDVDSSYPGLYSPVMASYSFDDEDGAYRHFYSSDWTLDDECKTRFRDNNGKLLDLMSDDSLYSLCEDDDGRLRVVQKINWEWRDVVIEEYGHDDDDDDDSISYIYHLPLVKGTYEYGKKYNKHDEFINGGSFSYGVTNSMTELAKELVDGIPYWLIYGNGDGDNVADNAPGFLSEYNVSRNTVMTEISNPSELVYYDAGNILYDFAYHYDKNGKFTLDSSTIRVKVPVSTEIHFWYICPKYSTVNLDDYDNIALSGRWWGDDHKHNHWEWHVLYHKHYYGWDNYARYYLSSVGIDLIYTDKWSIFIDETSQVHGDCNCEMKLLRAGLGDGFYDNDNHRGYNPRTGGKIFWRNVFNDYKWELKYEKEPSYFIPRSEIESKHTLFYIKPGQVVYKYKKVGSKPFDYSFPKYGNSHWSFPANYLYYPLREYMTPACDPNEGSVRTGEGWVYIKYSTKNSAAGDDKKIHVTVKVRDCPAYTNAGWKKYEVSNSGRFLYNEIRWYREADVKKLGSFGYTVTELQN